MEQKFNFFTGFFDKVPRISIIFILITSVTVAFCQKNIDLSKHPLNPAFIKVSSKQVLKLYLINKLCHDGYDYTVEINRRYIPIKPMSLIADPTAMATNITACSLTTEINNLCLITEEKDIPGKIEEIRKLLVPGSCTQDQINYAKRILFESTTDSLGQFILEDGEELEIVISRTTPGGPLKEWKVIYSTEPRGEWQTSYGFSYITQFFDAQQLYFALPMDSGYIITKEHNRKKLIFAPSIFFTWMPTNKLNRNFVCGFSGGLGFDIKNPTVFLGGTVSYNQNIKLHIGLAAHRQLALKGNYSAGQFISLTLDKDQLHDYTDTVNPFFSVSFRLDRNPFESKSN